MASREACRGGGLWLATDPFCVHGSRCGLPSAQFVKWRWELENMPISFEDGNWDNGRCHKYIELIFCEFFPILLPVTHRPKRRKPHEIGLQQFFYVCGTSCSDSWNTILNVEFTSWFYLILLLKSIPNTFSPSFIFGRSLCIKLLAFSR